MSEIKSIAETYLPPDSMVDNKWMYSVQLKVGRRLVRVTDATPEAVD